MHLCKCTNNVFGYLKTVKIYIRLQLSGKTLLDNVIILQTFMGSLKAQGAVSTLEIRLWLMKNRQLNTQNC